MRCNALLLAVLAAATLARPQNPGAATHPNAPEPAPPPPPPVVTHHSIQLAGKPLKYTATTGLMPIRNSTGDIEATIFFIAYTADNPAPGRPLMFSFNGGPGSSSVWLHLGALGPKRVQMQKEGQMPAPPFHLVENEHTWLDQTDLVFIDPVGTGYSRATKPDLGKKFWGVHGDIESVGEFIRLYLTQYERWGSPLFLVGESYGTTRAAGLSGYLIDRGIAFNGILLVSSVLNFETIGFANGHDLPYIVYLPSYTAAAWYHKKLAPDLQQDLQKTLAESEKWAETGYAEALAKGDRLPPADRQQVIDTLARFTGLEKRYIDENNLRIEIIHFTRELLRDQKRIVGRLDSRFDTVDPSSAETPEYDPSMSAIRPPYTSMFYNYVRSELGYKSDLEYYILGGGIGAWDWGPGVPDTSEALRGAFTRNPYMKLFVASGYFDLATPFFGTQYTIHHLGLDAALLPNIHTGEYEAGHMMYIRAESLAKLKRDVSAFIAGAL